MHNVPGQPYLPSAHPAAKVRWNAPKEEEVPAMEAAVNE